MDLEVNLPLLVLMASIAVAVVDMLFINRACSFRWTLCFVICHVEVYVPDVLFFCPRQFKPHSVDPALCVELVIDR